MKKPPKYITAVHLVLLGFGLVASLVLVLVPTAADAQTISSFVPNPLNNPICSKIGTQIQVSVGLRMYCFGPQPNGPGTVASTGSSSGHAGTFRFSPNVNAANLAEDISPSGTRAYGQSETSIAAWGAYVVEAWNDATGFISPCPSLNNKEEFTGFGFSKDGGNTFTDLGGLPNSDCANNLYIGDPSVQVLHVAGTTYFYISSLYYPVSFTAVTYKIAFSVCTVVGSGSGASLSCSPPIIAAKSSPGFGIGVLDKDFMTLDPVKKRLYISYTEFCGSSDPFCVGAIELAACDLTTPAAPVCGNGGPPLASETPDVPYFVVSPGRTDCVQQGSYPAADQMTGDVYVAYEFNWNSNISPFTPSCHSVPVQNVLAYVAFNPCLTGSPTLPSSCTSPPPSNSVAITSMDAADIPGYNRHPMNDFPRIAVSDPKGTVSIVWNDAQSNPGGDILLQSFNLGSLTPIGSPVKINNDNVVGTFHFLPAVNADSNGNLSISWYDRRRNPTTALTDVYAAVGISPRINGTPNSNQRVTDTASNWLAVSSNITPNFGDYTDNFVSSPPASPPEDDPFFVAWSDGRLSVPQPFESYGVPSAPPK